jgi:cell division protease FtsH
MARKMVCEWGMSELGPLSFGKKEEQIFLGREISQHRDYSEDTALKIDEQVHKLVDYGYTTARDVIEKYADALRAIAEALLEREILDGSEVRQLIDGQQLPPMSTGSGSKPNGTTQVIKPEPSTGGLRLPGMIDGENPQPA